VPHRPRLAGRKQVTDFLRACLPQLEVDDLTAIFVDDGCRLLGIERLGPAPKGRLRIDARDILEHAYLGHARGIVLARRSAGKPIFSSEEQQLASLLMSIGEAVSIYLLDYIVVTPDETSGMFWGGSP